jgi:hypothetical protein
MRHSNRGAFRDQVNFLRRQFLQDGELPFTNVLTEGTIAQALATISGWLDRIFSPLVTLWVFLGQVLSADHSCRAAVARLIAHRRARGQSPCSAQTGAYCQARQRLPESFFAEVARQTGQALEANVDPQWLWKGRHVYLFDGTTVTMPDTPENQEAYPQVYNQQPGVGFPIARVGAIISLACGAMMNLGVCRYAGKGQGEVSLLRTLWDLLRPGVAESRHVSGNIPKMLEGFFVADIDEGESGPEAINNLLRGEIPFVMRSKNMGHFRTPVRSELYLGQVPRQGLIGETALVGAERAGPRPALFRATRYPDLEAGAPAELYECDRHAAGRGPSPLGPAGAGPPTNCRDYASLADSSSPGGRPPGWPARVGDLTTVGRDGGAGPRPDRSARTFAPVQRSLYSTVPLRISCAVVK